MKTHYLVFLNCSADEARIVDRAMIREKSATYLWRSCFSKGDHNWSFQGSNDDVNRLMKVLPCTKAWTSERPFLAIDDDCDEESFRLNIETKKKWSYKKILE